MNVYSAIKKILFSAFLSGVLTQASNASVILIGTRIIYPENKQFVSLNFRSPDNVPSVIDMWVSKEPEPVASKNDAPFITTPSIFRIDPNKGQTVKLVYTGNKPVSNRESVYYLNFAQMPASEKNANNLLVTYKSTVKIFYRPANLTQNIDDIASYLEVDLSKVSSGVVTVVNNSEYHVNPVSLKLERNGKKILSVPGERLMMIAPFSRKDIKVTPINNVNGVLSSVGLINDLGGVSTYKINTL